MNFVSLFAGVGGFDLAFERAGMDCVAQVELDAKCRGVLAAHWPDVPRFEDVHDVSGSDLGSVDVLCGGFPCQDYSVAGKGAGLAGDRGALWWQFHRLIAECRPRWVVAENVSGLANRRHRASLITILGSLVELGYGVAWRILDAQYFGVAQRRRRVFIVGHFGGIPRPEILAFAEGCSGDTPPRREAGTVVTGSLTGGPGSSSAGNPDDNRAQAGFLVASTLSAGGNPNSNVPGRHHEDDYNLVAFAQNTRDEVRDLHNLAGALAAQPGMKQTTYLAVAQPIRSNPHNNSDPGMEARMHIQQGPNVRRLTPLECERLQGFPDNWTAGQSDTQRYRQMGNAVAVPVVEWIGRRLVAA